MLRRELDRTEEARRNNAGLSPCHDPYVISLEGEKLMANYGFII
jgi:hypothetical protein